MASANSALFAASRSSAPKVKSKPITFASAFASRSTSGTYSLRGQGGGPKRPMLFSSIATITTWLLARGARIDCHVSSSSRSGRRNRGATSPSRRRSTIAATAAAVQRRTRRRAIRDSSKSRLPSSLMGGSLSARIVAKRKPRNHRTPGGARGTAAGSASGCGAQPSSGILEAFADSHCANVWSCGFSEREKPRSRAAQYSRSKSALNWNMLPRSSAPGKPKPR